MLFNVSILLFTSTCELTHLHTTVKFTHVSSVICYCVKHNYLMQCCLYDDFFTVGAF